MSDLVFSAEHITKVFPGVRALDDVSVNIRRSEVHSIIGENGAGKSTLMKIIFGMQEPDGGELYSHGKKVSITSPIVAQELGIGIVPQELNLVPYLSVKENIFLGSQPRAKVKQFIDKSKMREEALKVIARLQVDINPDVQVRDLSSAHQQLVQVARALAFGAEVLIFDEPTASLTVKETEILFDIIERFKAEGGSAFYISHRLDEILHLSDRITVFRDGKYITELDPKKTSKEEMVNEMVGRKIDQSVTRRSYSPEGKEVALEVKNLCRSGEFEDVSFKLHKGEILGFSGLVGAGRTELALTIFGYNRADKGDIYINGELVRPKHTSEVISRHLAYVPEERRRQGIFSLLSVKKNMTIPILREFCRKGCIDGKSEVKLVESFIEKLRIKLSSRDQQIQFLSGGNQQKVILSRWIASKSEIIILDEPTRGIDVNAKNEIHQLMRELAEQGMSVIVISSDLEEVINLSDRIIVMHEGLVKGEVNAGTTNQEEIMNIALVGTEN